VQHTVVHFYIQNNNTATLATSLKMQTEQIPTLSFCGTLQRIIDVYTNSILSFLKISSIVLLIPWVLLAVIDRYALISLEKDATAIFVKLTGILSDDDGASNNYEDRSIDSGAYNNHDDAHAQNYENDAYVLETKIILALAALLLLNAVVIIVTHAISYGTYIMAVTQIYLGEQPELLSCLKKSREHLFSMIGANILYVVALVLLCALSIGSFVVLGILGVLGHSSSTFAVLVMRLVEIVIAFLFVGIGLSLYKPPIIVENLSACSSLRRSLTVVSGNVCYIFCIFLTGKAIVDICIIRLIFFFANLFAYFIMMYRPIIPS